MGDETEKKKEEKPVKEEKVQAEATPEEARPEGFTLESAGKFIKDLHKKFMEADVNKDGKHDVEQFERWVSTQAGNVGEMYDSAKEKVWEGGQKVSELIEEKGPEVGKFLGDNKYGLMGGLLGMLLMMGLFEMGPIAGLIMGMLAFGAISAMGGDENGLLSGLFSGPKEEKKNEKGESRAKGDDTPGKDAAARKKETEGPEQDQSASAEEEKKNDKKKGEKKKGEEQTAPAAEPAALIAQRTKRQETLEGWKSHLMHKTRSNTVDEAITENVVTGKSTSLETAADAKTFLAAQKRYYTTAGYNGSHFDALANQMDYIYSTGGKLGINANGQIEGLQQWTKTMADGHGRFMVSNAGEAYRAGAALAEYGAVKSNKLDAPENEAQKLRRLAQEYQRGEHDNIPAGGTPGSTPSPKEEQLALGKQ